MPKLIDLSGRRFERLVSREHIGNGIWRCICDCGKEITTASGNLRAGRQKSCGCLRDDNNRARATHGGARRGRHEFLYKKWESMMCRCTFKGQEAWKDYGGRGIVVCDRWRNYANFRSDMGPLYKDSLTLDRIDVNGPYSPDNCRWVPWSVQNMNKRNSIWIEFNGEKLSVEQWAKKRGLSYHGMYGRFFALGKSVEWAITGPIRRRRITPNDDRLLRLRSGPRCCEPTCK